MLSATCFDLPDWLMRGGLVNSGAELSRIYCVAGSRGPCFHVHGKLSEAMSFWMGVVFQFSV